MTETTIYNQAKLIQSNELTLSKYNITSTAQDILYYIIFDLQQNKKNFIDNDFIMNIDLIDLCKIINVKSNNYKHVIESLKNLMNIVYEYQSVGGKIILGHFISNVIYDTKNYNFTIKITEETKTLLLNLTKNYTLYQITEVLKLKSIYSKRLYKFFSMYKNLHKKPTLTIDELRNMFDLKSKYKLYAHLKERIIITAQKELKAKTSISFNFTEHKIKNRVASIDFHINFYNEYKTTKDTRQLELNFNSTSINEEHLNTDKYKSMIDKMKNEYKFTQSFIDLVSHKIPMKNFFKIQYYLMLNRNELKTGISNVLKSQLTKQLNGEV